MCLIITQMMGYSVPTKEFAVAQRTKDPETRRVIDTLDTRELSNGSLCILHVFIQSSECKCGESRQFVKDTFKSLIMDENDEKINDIKAKKSVLKNKLKKIGLLSCATWGYFTDAYADSH